MKFTFAQAVLKLESNIQCLLMINSILYTKFNIQESYKARRWTDVLNKNTWQIHRREWNCDDGDHLEGAGFAVGAAREKYVTCNTHNKAGNVCKRQHYGAFVQALLQWKRNKYYIFWVWVCSLRYAACIAMWPARLYNIVPNYIINGTLF